MAASSPRMRRTGGTSRRMRYIPIPFYGWGCYLLEARTGTRTVIAAHPGGGRGDSSTSSAAAAAAAAAAPLRCSNSLYACAHTLFHFRGICVRVVGLTSGGGPYTIQPYQSYYCPGPVAGSTWTQCCPFGHVAVARAAGCGECATGSVGFARLTLQYA
eukprot:1183073-Prorocentrum_minimum.AAC.6